MDQVQAPATSHDERLRSESADHAVKSEHPASSPRLAAFDLASTTFKASPTPLPSTETTELGAVGPMSGHPTKKKGTASSVKRGPKRTKNGENRKPKKSKSTSAGPGLDEGSGDDESDNGPYCLCRGPDDHRWMICCERCEDWFHGECINMSKEIGENLIERFVCPNCTIGNIATLYKKTCALGACRKAARLGHSQPSVFCSNEHAQTWWERMVGRLPKARGKSGLNDQLGQEEFMALLSSNLGTTDADGMWRLAKEPFSDAPSSGLDAGGMNTRTLCDFTRVSAKLMLATRRGPLEDPQ